MAEGSEHWATSGNALIGATMTVDFHYADSANITFVTSSSGQLQKSTKLQIHLALASTGWSEILHSNFVLTDVKRHGEFTSQVHSARVDPNVSRSLRP